VFTALRFVYAVGGGVDLCLDRTKSRVLAAHLVLGLYCASVVATALSVATVCISAAVERACYLQRFMSACCGISKYALSVYLHCAQEWSKRTTRRREQATECRIALLYSSRPTLSPTSGTCALQASKQNSETPAASTARKLCRLHKLRHTSGASSCLQSLPALLLSAVSFCAGSKYL
jgi:hypothetical protein